MPEASDYSLIIVGSVLGVIGLLTCCSIWLIGAALLRLRAEKRHLLTATKALTSLQLTNLDSKTTPEEALIKHCQSIQGTTFPDDCLIAQSIRRLGRLWRTHLIADEKLRDLPLTPQNQRGQFIRFVAGLLVFVALFGTVASLYASLHALPYYGDDTQSLVRFNVLIGHILPAFSITGSGILATMFVWIGNYILTRKQEAFNLALETFAADTVAPLLRPAAQTNSQIRVLQDALIGANERLVESVDKMGTSLADKFVLLHTTTENHLRKVQSELIAGAKGLQNDLLADSKLFQAELLKGGKQLTASITSVGNDYVLATKEMGIAHHRVTRATAEAIQAAAQITSDNRAVIVALDQSRIRVEAMASGIQTILEQLPAHLTALASTESNISTILAQSVEHTKAMTSFGATIERTQNQQATLLTDIGATIQLAQTEQAKTLVDVGKQLGATIERTQNDQEHALKQAHEHISTTLVRLQADQARALAELGERVGAPLDRFQRDQSTLRTDLHETMQAWKAAGDQLDALKDIMQQAMLATTLETERTRNQSRTEHEKFIEALQTVRTSLTRQMTDLHELQYRLMDALATPPGRDLLADVDIAEREDTAVVASTMTSDNKDSHKQTTSPPLIKPPDIGHTAEGVTPPEVPPLAQPPAASPEKRADPSKNLQKASEANSRYDILPQTTRGVGPGK